MNTRYIYIDSAAGHARKFDRAGAFEGSGLYNRDTGYPMDKPQRPIEACMPMVKRDCPEHVAPGGVLISSHSTRRDYMKKNGLVDWEPLKKRPRGYINERFAKKRGLKISGEAQEYMANAKKEAFRKAGLAT